MKHHILIVDDEENILISLKNALEGEGYKISTCETAEKALETIKKEHIHAALLDVKLPGMNGIELLENIKKTYTNICCIMMSAHGDIGTAVKATHLGAYDFLEKPVSVDKLLISLENSISYGALKQENLILKQEISAKYEIVGNSKEINKLKKQIDKVAESAKRILVLGESGTGKELVAWAIHHSGKRVKQPFIRVNCAAIPKDLIESELFGHEEGAFTGAKKRKIGKFEQADGGTIFLDEIGDMALETQAKVLRVLQENQLERIAGKEIIDIDVVVIAATNKNIPEMIKQNCFREDLYFRLNVIEISVPSLHTHKQDIPLLIENFLQTFSLDNGVAPLKMDEKAVELFCQYDWPGNIRELKNMVERCAIMAENNMITEDVVKQHINFSAQLDSKALSIPDGSYHDQIKYFEKLIIEKALKKSEYNISKTSKILGLGRSHLHKKINALNIKYVK